MNKKELVATVAEKRGVTIAEASKQVDTVIGCISDVLGLEEEVSISDFGKWNIKTVKERKGINPLTKEEIVIPEHKRVTFKAYSKITLYAEKYV